MQFEGFRPLDGIRVTEISCGLAGALAGRLLAEQGASVVRIRLPESRKRDRPIHAILDKDKTVLDADPDAKADLAQVRAEVERADVLIEAAVGALRRLGLEQDPAIAHRSALVHLVLTGFPTNDAELGKIPPWEGILDAACGLYTDVSPVRTFLGLDPIYSALPHCSVYGAVHGAVAVTLALLPDASGGRRGQRIEVPLASAGLSAMSSAIMRIPDQPARYDIPKLPRLMKKYLLPALRSTLSRLPAQAQHVAAGLARRLIPPMMTHYPCRDGAMLYIFAVDHDRIPLQLLRHLGLADEAFRAGLKNEDAYSDAAAGANIRESANLSATWRRSLGKRLAEKFRERDAVQWEEELMAVGLPCAVVRSTREWLRLAELERQGIVDRLTSDAGRHRRSFGRHAWVKHAAGKPRSVWDRPSGGSLLSGIRVIDFSSMLAGPVAARTLAEYGADVIKIASPTPHHGPRMTCWYGIDVDQGKRSVLLDLGSEVGQRALKKLLETADVVLHNFGTAQAQRLGLSPEDIATANPAMVICRIGAFLGPSDGAWSERHGYDPVLQAASGVMDRYGGSTGPEHHGIASCIDYLTGFSGAFAAALGLLACSRSGLPGPYFAETSLAQSANLIQTPYAVDPAPADEPRGQRAMGEHALHRLYRTRDGWIFLAAPAEKLSDIANAVSAALPESADIQSASVGRALERAFRKKGGRHWTELLSGPSLAVWIVETLEARHEGWVGSLRPGDLVEDGPMAQIVRTDHPSGGQVDTLAPVYTRLSETPLRVPAPAPKPGADTRKVLAELGYDKPEIDRMVAAGAAAVELSATYLPP